MNYYPKTLVCRQKSACLARCLLPAAETNTCENPRFHPHGCFSKPGDTETASHRSFLLKGKPPTDFQKSVDLALCFQPACKKGLGLSFSKACVCVRTCLKRDEASRVAGVWSRRVVLSFTSIQWRRQEQYRMYFSHLTDIVETRCVP